MSSTNTSGQDRPVFNWNVMVIERDGFLVENSDQLPSLIRSTGLAAGSGLNSDLTAIDTEAALDGSLPLEYLLVTRSVEVVKRNCEDMTRQEILKAKDVVIAAQQQRIAGLVKRIRELKDRIYATDNIRALTLDVLDLSLESESNLY
ncbi:hypothetical protein BKA70DRAFT_1222234 [Coprinopsis sp. MPI-PUGE-AT-0042]|nr:hypothetical protein BKA70DRAFT_1222234 [Coprinopsis sp. MPI-PUGE-AT-0042]